MLQYLKHNKHQKDRPTIYPFFHDFFFILKIIYMVNKIVILDNSIQLYEHYIDDTRWERTIAFPRGGVTYLVSNGTIKFYAYEDYLYRNSIISMQLPIYVVDEKRNIDGEYENINELTRVLDPIFPSNDIDAELEYYLSIADAERTYQPIGDYALKSEIPSVSGFVTDEELVDALDDYVEKEGFNSYSAETAAVIEELDDRKADKSELSPYFDGASYDEESKQIKFYHNGEIKAQIDARPFIKDGMVSNVRLENSYLIITFNTDAGKKPIAIKIESIFDPSNYYTKAEIGDNFQPKGNYVSASTYTAFTSTTEASIQTLRGTKLDVSAYTPSDLSNYYTKSEVYTKGETYNRNEIDDKIIQSGTFDPTLYYTKDNCNTRFALKDEMPSLNGYATEEWVTSKNYATRADFITYVNNLQQQIDSLMATVSGCCGAQEDVYRWITVIGEYICENNNKYEKQKYQVSHDGGIVWEDVEPIQYQKGQLIESNSKDCGYAPQPQYRWKMADTSDFICSGTSKYYKYYYEVSYDGGHKWQRVVPEQTKMGDLFQMASSDCGYITPKYRWLTAPSTDYICSGTTKCFKEYYQVTNDGKTWENVTPEQTRRGSVIEYNSTDCGYVPPKTKFVLTLNDGSTVSKACDSTGTITQYDFPGYQLTAVRAEIKDCVTKIDKDTFFHFENLSGVTLPNSLIEIGEEAFYACSVLYRVVIPNNVTSIGRLAFCNCGLRDVTFGNSVTTIEANAFVRCEKLRTVTLPSSVTSLGDGAFSHCHVLETVTCKATIPPTMGNAVFGDDRWLSSIYVPSGSVDAYKAADGWKDYASLIKPINS